MITLKLTTTEGTYGLVYGSPKSILEDEGLRVLIDDGHVSHCSVWVGGLCLTHVRDVDWPRLCDAITDNAAVLSKGVES